jgi:predicted RNA-binding Zn-ribbon protein involved in translation (DUF1610 family)
MSDVTIIRTPNGSEWSPATSVALVHCVNCGNAVDTPEEEATYPEGQCPDCGQSWTGTENKGVKISVTSPAPLGAATF